VVDHSALKTNQASIILLLVAGFVLESALLVALVAAVMIVGTAFPKAGLFKLLYEKVLKPAGLVKPDVREESPRPHLFAQGLGGAVLVLALAALLLGTPVVGWVLVWLVVALAALNLFGGFCLGCFLYYQLGRRGVPGFER
jgi:hypothetical protein